MSDRGLVSTTDYGKEWSQPQVAPNFMEFQRQSYVAQYDSKYRRELSRVAILDFTLEKDKMKKFYSKIIDPSQEQHFVFIMSKVSYSEFGKWFIKQWPGKPFLLRRSRDELSSFIGDVSTTYWVLIKGSPAFELFTRGIQRIESSGILTHLASSSDTLIDFSTNPNKWTDAEAANRPYRAHEMYAIMKMLWLLFLLDVLVFLLEFIMKKKKRLKKFRICKKMRKTKFWSADFTFQFILGSVALIVAISIISALYSHSNTDLVENEFCFLHCLHNGVLIARDQNGREMQTGFLYTIVMGFQTNIDNVTYTIMIDRSREITVINHSNQALTVAGMMKDPAVNI